MTQPKDLTEEGQLDICESPPPERFSYLRPCCRARGHKDRCLFWKQERDGNNHGIHTYQIVGSIKRGLSAEAVYLFDMKGAESTFEEVAALVQIYEWTQDAR